MSYFDSGASFQLNARQTAIAELDSLADRFRALAAGSRSEAVIITLTRCAEEIDQRIQDLRSGAPLKF